MNTQEILGWLLGILALASYIIYIVLKRKELNEKAVEQNNTDNLINALKEYAKYQPDLAKIFNKFGIL
ncbi:MAG: hypothetical protein WCS69_07835 [Ignavibacteriaceae bacterium]|jgi:hypothetical protein